MRRIFLAVLMSAALIVVATAQTKNVRLEGQVVCCEECWAEADRTRVEYGTTEDLLKAQSCVAEGDPTLIAVREGEGFTLYRLEQGKFRLPGKNWLEYVGKRVAVTGEVRKRQVASAVRVDALEVLAPSQAEREAAQVVGREVELTLKDLFGAEQPLGALKGRIVVLNFWATYCVPCRKEMPDLAAVQNEYAALGVQVVGASTDAAEDRAKVLQFVKETKVNFPIWTGAAVADMVRFGLGAALPGTVVIDRDGRIARVMPGIVNPAELKKQIDALLKSAERKAEAERRETAAKQKPAEASAVPS
ncbi:MAG TPA: TlpA disulfide reductase family protein [Pyrinomonadaceae bacterium]|nr:TlpA disulfide reductase family protein [Pyrinomonadaceae bacterium]